MNILNNMLFGSNYLPAFFTEGKKVLLYHYAVFVSPIFLGFEQLALMELYMNVHQRPSDL